MTDKDLALKTALGDGDVDGVQQLMAAGAEPVFHTTHDARAVAALVDAGLNINSGPPGYGSSLTSAVGLGIITVVRECFLRGAAVTDKHRRHRRREEGQRGRRGVDVLVDLVDSGRPPELSLLSAAEIANARTQIVRSLNAEALVTVTLDVLIVEWRRNNDGHYWPHRWVDCGENGVTALTIDGERKRLLLVTTDRGVVEFDIETWETVPDTGETYRRFDNDYRQVIIVPGRSEPLILPRRSPPKDTYQYLVGPDADLYSINGEEWEGDWPLVELCHHQSDDTSPIWRNDRNGALKPASFALSPDGKYAAIHYQSYGSTDHRVTERVATIPLANPHEWSDRQLGDASHGLPKDLPTEQTIVALDDAFVVALPTESRIGIIDHALIADPDSAPGHKAYGRSDSESISIDMMPYALTVHHGELVIAGSYGIRAIPLPIELSQHRWGLNTPHLEA